MREEERLNLYKRFLKAFDYLKPKFEDDFSVGIQCNVSYLSLEEARTRHNDNTPTEHILDKLSEMGAARYGVLGQKIIEVNTYSRSWKIATPELVCCHELLHNVLMEGLYGRGAVASRGLNIINEGFAEYGSLETYAKVCCSLGNINERISTLYFSGRRKLMHKLTEHRTAETALHVLFPEGRVPHTTGYSFFCKTLGSMADHVALKNLGVELIKMDEYDLDDLVVHHLKTVLK